MNIRSKRMTSVSILTIGFAAALLTLASAIGLQAQAVSVLSTGLTAPVKIITAGPTTLLVAEAGTTAPNNGRISLINRTTGVRRTLIDGLPSGLNFGGGPPEPGGPSGLNLNGSRLFVTIGAGDTLLAANGAFTVNPTPSSPLFSSVLEFTLPADYETLASGFTLSAANQTALAANTPVVLTNTEGRQTTVRLIANLPNSVPDPRPGQPANVRESNPFGLELSGDFLYVVDASFNLLYRVNILTGAFDTFATFPSRPNPTPMGPPFIEAVPDSIRLSGDSLLISFLTGFPFVQGFSEVRSVNLTTQAQTVFIPNLTSALDILPFSTGAGATGHLVLEFSSNQLAQAPGRLKFFSSPNGTPTIIADGLITPTSLARDTGTGTVFITEISTGRILRVATTTAADVEISGRVFTADGLAIRNAVVHLVDNAGRRRTATTGSFGNYRFEGVPAGETYVISVASKRFRFSPRLLDVNDNLAGVDLFGNE